MWFLALGYFKVGSPYLTKYQFFYFMTIELDNSCAHLRHTFAKNNSSIKFQNNISFDADTSNI